MRRFLIASILTLAAGAACSKTQDAPGASAAPGQAADIPQLSVDELDQKLAAGACTPVDANGEQTRKKLGVVPGAVLLTDSETFSVKELPGDRSRELVFYCANSHCGASHEAAARARVAGYTNVKVMGDGIAGWVAAGKKVQAL